MDEHKIKFEDGAAYERMMGGWSRIAGITFLDWVAPGKGLRWIDVGCGNGAFTQLITERCAPAEVDGVDPSDGQISFARTRSPNARFKQGDAMALPFGDKSFDIATMALVIFFVPEPSKGWPKWCVSCVPVASPRLTRGTFPAADFRGSR